MAEIFIIAPNRPCKGSAAKPSSKPSPRQNPILGNDEVGHYYSY